jgi:oligogalacturonide lyase
LSKHTRRAMPFATRTDPDTGASVTRLTPRDVTCHRNYFYQKCFTNDGKRVVFAGEFGPDVGDPAKPNWNYHLLDLEAHTALQLTDGARENTFGGFLSPDDRFLYFVRAERRLIRLHLDTLAEDVAYEVPAGWVGYGTWVANSACTKMVGIEIAGLRLVPTLGLEEVRRDVPCKAPLPALQRRPGHGRAHRDPRATRLARAPPIPSVR